MQFKNRRLYPHGQGKDIFLVQIPKMICEEMSLTSDTRVRVKLEDNKIIISKEEECQED